MFTIVHAALVPAAIGALAVGAAFAIDGGDAAPAYGAPLEALSVGDAAENAALLFRRADLDRDGVLSAQEYAGHVVALAELARLNRFIAVETPAGVGVAALPDEAAEMTRSERTRIDVLARKDHARAAGPKGLSFDGYLQLELERFAAADLDRNGVLHRTELGAFALSTARLRRISA